MSKYDLTPEQQQTWCRRVSDLAGHGAWTAALNASGRPPGTWRRYLSNFKTGKAPGLKSVFEDQVVLGCVAKELNTTPARLHALFDEVRGIRVLQPGEVLVAGFEDRPPVPANALHEPPIGCGWSHNWGSVRDFTSAEWIDPLEPWFPRDNQGGTRPVLSGEVLARLLLEALPGESVCVTVEAGPGMGKSLLLATVQSALRERGAPQGVRPSGARSGEILIVDDVDALEFGEQEALSEHLKVSGRALVTRRPGTSTWQIHARYNLTMQLPALAPEFAVGLLGRLQRVAREYWNERLVVAPLQDWLRADPMGVRRLARVDSLPLFARLLTTDGKVEPDPGRVVQHAVDRAVWTLEAAGSPGATGALRHVGARLLRQVALEIERSAAGGICPDGLANLCKAALDPHGRTSSTEVLGLKDALVRSGALVQTDGLVRIPLACAADDALGQEVAQQLLDNRCDGLFALLVKPDKKGALAAAGCALGEADVILTKALAAPVSVRTQMAAGLTWLLASKVRVRSERVLRDAFCFLLRWWSCWLPQRGARLAEATLDIAGTPAPLILAAAAFARRRALPALDVAALYQPCGWSDELSWYLGCVGQQEPTDAQLELGLALMAPGAFLTAATDRRLRGDVATLLTLRPEDLHHWWQYVAGLALDSDMRWRPWLTAVAGVAPDACVRDAMQPFVFGDAVWVAPLAKAVELQLEGVDDAILTALTSVLMCPWPDNVSGWKALSSNPRVKARLDIDPATARAVVSACRGGVLRWSGVDPTRFAVDAAKVHPVGPRERASREEVLASLLATGLGQAEVELVWTTWLEVAPSEVPWKAFPEKLLPRTTLAEWCMGRLGPDASVFWTGKAAEDPEPSARACLAALLATEDPDVLAVVIGRTEEPGRAGIEALHKLTAMSTESALDARARLAARLSPRHALMCIRGLEPGARAGQAWRLLADRTEDSLELEPAALLALLPDERPRWHRFLQRLQVLATAPQEEWRLRHQWGDVVAVLARAWRAQVPELPEVFRICLQPPIRQHMLYWLDFWALAVQALSADEVVRELRAGVDDGHEATVSRMAMLVSAGLFNTVRELLNDEVLRDAACAALTASNRQWPAGRHASLLAAIEPLLASGALPSGDAIAEPLVLTALRWDRTAGLAWMADRLPDLEEDARRAWVGLALRAELANHERAGLLRILERGSAPGSP